MLTRVSRIGANPTEDDEVRIQRAIAVNNVVLGGIPAEVFFGFVMFDGGATVAATATWAVAGLSALGVLYLALTRRHFRFFKFSQTAAPLVVSFVVTLLLGGVAQAGFCILWGLVAPVVALIYYPVRQAAYWLLAYFALVVVAVAVEPFLQPTAVLPMLQIRMTLLVTLLGVSAMVFAGLAYFVVERHRALRLAELERDKGERLLLNILPKEVAQVLKDQDGVIASGFDGASILFADVVDFTPTTAAMKPEEVVSLLNEVFSAFDSLVERHRLEKIKTIGDCYMVAAGVPTARIDHAHAVVRLALQIREHVACNEFGGQKLAIRIGINSGPVAAGVIGRKKFIYDLWGDAVNTASRMESHGKANAVQITRSTYDLIKDDFLCQYQGVIDVKGKGGMEVWHVEGEV